MAPTITIGGIHLVNSTGAPTNGSPLAAATTPFAIRKGWSITPAEPIVIMAGGPPFRNGSSPVVQRYGNVTERIPIAIGGGGSHDTNAAYLQMLKIAISSALTTAPPILMIDESTSSNPMYAEIYSGFVREVVEQESGFSAWEGWAEISAELVLTRSPFFGNLDGGENLTSATFANDGAGNLLALGSAGSGDLTQEGGPLNITLSTWSNPGRRLWLASVKARSKSTTGAAAYTTSSMVGIAGPTWNPTIATDPFAMHGVRGRVMLKGTFTANAQVRVTIRALGTAGVVLYVSPWIGAQAAAATYVDSGGWSMDALRRIPIGSYAVTVNSEVRSSDGASATYTHVYSETLSYYDFCQIDAIGPAFNASGLSVFGFNARSGYPALPFAVPQAVTYSGTAIQDVPTMRGTAPRYFVGCSLYAAWIDGSSVHTSGATVAASVDHAPLYRSLRGQS